MLAGLHALEREQTIYTWSALSAMKALGMLTQDDQQRVAVVLWGSGPTWPISSVLRPLAALRWPAPSDDIDITKAFGAWLREQSIAHFGYEITGASRFGFRGEADNQYLEAAFKGLKEHYLVVEDFAGVIASIVAWWRDEEATILGALAGHPELGDLLDERLVLVDQIVWEGRRQFLRGTGAPPAELETQIQALIDTFAHVGRSLRLVSLQDSLERGEFDEANHQLRDIANTFLGDDNVQIETANATVEFLAKHSDLYPSANLAVVFDALCASAVARHLPGTLKAMHRLATAALKWPRLLEERHWRASQTALELLEKELRYVRGDHIHKLEDDGVPLYRFMCAQLADALKRSGSCVSDAPVVHRWLEAARTDPLPELRLARFKLLLGE